MAETISRGTDEWTCCQLRARHERLHVRVSTNQGEGVILAPGSGGAQGDKVMPVQFRRCYEGKLETWLQHRDRDLESGIKAVDPMTQNMVDVSMTSYADDVK